MKKLSFYNTILNLNQTHKKIATKIKDITICEKNSSLIDIGGGTGLLAYHLDNYFTITLLEPSVTMTKHISGFKTIHKTLQKYSPENFDSVVCFDTLHHLSNEYENKFEQIQKGISKMIEIAEKEVIIIEPNMNTLQGKWLQFVENTLLRIGSYFPQLHEYETILKGYTYRITYYKHFIIIHITL